MIAIDFAIESKEWDALPEAETLGRTAILCAAELAGKKLHADAEVSIVLGDDAMIRDLNRNWRKIDKSTNVLSFPASSAGKLSDSPLLGDIILAYETMAREAREEDKPVSHHFSHLVVHGFLHLLGFDHETTAEAEAMEALETRVLARLNIPDPYADGEPLGAQK